MSKKLVLYFSVYGTAKKVAEEIARQTGADLTEIIPETPYDSNRDNYNALAAYAKKEHDEDMRPAIKNDINIADYDTIFSRDGGTYDTIRELEPNATVVMNGLPVEMKTAETGAAKQVEKWLKSLNI